MGSRNNNTKFIKTRFIEYLFLFIISLLFLSSIHFSIFTNDESFTLALIRHGYKNLIDIDSLDVHPPLYYLLLKLFLQITSFWTKSVFIKVELSRIFSLISLIFFIYVIQKILLLCHITQTISWTIAFLIFPQIMLNSTKIRMYSLVSLFLISEFFYLIKFYYTNNKKYLIGVTLFAILSSYTLYFAAISAGLYILIIGILLTYKRRYKMLIEILISGISLFVCCIPLIAFAYRQFLFHSENDISSNHSPILFYIKDTLTSFTQFGDIPLYLLPLSFVIFIGFIYIAYYSLKCNKKLILNHLLIISLLNGFLTLIISLVICKQQFQFIALYPIFTIYYAFSSIMLFRMLKKRIVQRGMFLITVISILVIIIYSSDIIYNNIKILDSSSELISNYVRCNRLKGNNIIINVNTHKQNADFYNKMAQDSIYELPMRKRIILKGSNYRILSRYITNDENETLLVKRLFNNLYIR